MCNFHVIHLTDLLWPSLPISGWAFYMRARSYACVHAWGLCFKSYPKDYRVLSQYKCQLEEKNPLLIGTAPAGFEPRISRLEDRRTTHCATLTP